MSHWDNSQSKLTWGCFFGSSFETFSFHFCDQVRKSAVPKCFWLTPSNYISKSVQLPQELVFFEDDFASFPKPSIHGRVLFQPMVFRGFPYVFFQWLDLIHGEKTSYSYKMCYKHIFIQDTINPYPCFPIWAMFQAIVIDDHPWYDHRQAAEAAWSIREERIRRKNQAWLKAVRRPSWFRPRWAMERCELFTGTWGFSLLGWD